MIHVMGDESNSSLTNVREGDVQPNAVDLRVDKIFYIKPDMFEISNDHKKHRGSNGEVPVDSDGF